jgi:hypothetical protein
MAIDRRAVCAAAAAAVLVTPGFGAQPAGLDHRALADRIVERLQLVKGERVLLVAAPGVFAELIAPLRAAVARAGGVDRGVVETTAAPPEAAGGSGAPRERFRRAFSDIDAAIMMPGATPEHPPYGALQDRLAEGKGRTVHFHWVENGSAYSVPGGRLPPRDVIDRTYQRAMLDTDYAALGRIQRRFEAAIRTSEVRVTSPSGTDLRFRIGDRPVTLQDGDASAARAARGRTLIDREIELPAGAVRVAPLEPTVDGVIVFPEAEWSGQRVGRVRMRFVKGRASDIDAGAGQAAVEAELARAGDAARHFRELALGFNPLLAVPARDPWIPYYGYGAGVVRLSLGDNSELGGAVKGGYVRWNFFTDLTVTVGGETWVNAGRLVQ